MIFPILFILLSFVSSSFEPVLCCMLCCPFKPYESNKKWSNFKTQEKNTTQQKFSSNMWAKEEESRKLVFFRSSQHYTQQLLEGSLSLVSLKNHAGDVRVRLSDLFISSARKQGSITQSVLIGCVAAPTFILYCIFFRGLSRRWSRTTTINVRENEPFPPPLDFVCLLCCLLGNFASIRVHHRRHRTTCECVLLWLIFESR